ncbi:hypothetical protein BN3660_03500 [Eubacteriaceae bacterium CHKCI004]|nr:hypothetical protein BN3660_03500 [Eubacteriaceae bacterium CHKCI004]
MALLSATAFAQTAAPEEEASPPITVGGVDLESTAANPVAYAITYESGNVATEGANDTNYNVKWDGETLTLRDATVKVVENEHSAAIERSAPFTLKLEGRNTLTSLENTHAGKGISATIEDYETVDPTVPYALTICGDGSLDVTGYMAGIATGGNLIINSGTVTAKATNSSDQCAGILAELGNIYIEGGKLTAIGGSSSTHSAGLFCMGYGYNGQTIGGAVRITGGEVTAVGGEITESEEDSSDTGSTAELFPTGSFGICATILSLNNASFTNGAISVSPMEGEAIEVQAGADADTATAIPGSPFDNGDHDITDAVSDKAYFHSKAFTPAPEETEPVVPTDPKTPSSPADTSQPAPEAALQPGNTYSAGGSTYKATSANTVTLQSAAKKKTIKIPATVTVNGVKAKVTAIDKNAFKKAKKKLTKVVIGANVTTIGKKAFKGISTNAVIKVPKAKKKAYAKFLKNKGQARSVIIR